MPYIRYKKRGKEKWRIQWESTSEEEYAVRRKYLVWFFLCLFGFFVLMNLSYFFTLS